MSTVKGALALALAATALIMSATTSKAQFPSNVIGVEWQWQATLHNDGTVTNPADPGLYTLEFGDDGRAIIRADCNRGSGAFTIAGDTIQFGPVATTLIACPPGSLDTEYLQHLNQVAQFHIIEGDLFLVLGEGRGWMWFSRTVEGGDGDDGMAVVGVEWHWQGTLLNDETMFTPSDPSRYTLHLMADGRAAVRADCNRGSGLFAMTDNHISLGPFALTLAACPPDSLDTRFVQQLENVASYFVRDGELFLELAFDSGVMRFARAEDTPAVVTGEVTYRERIALPEDVVVRVRLEDVSRADAPAILLGEQVIEPMGRQVPIAFAVHYDPARIDLRGRYTLRARIEDTQGRLLWTSTQAHLVITGGNPTEGIEIVLMRVG